MEAERRTGNSPLLLRHAAGRYWDEVGQHHAGSATTFRDLERLVNRAVAMAITTLKGKSHV